MLSILIPVYNCNIVKLVKEVHSQVSACNIEFEIVAFDDDSKSPIKKVNSSINQLKNCLFKALPKNIGRSAIRNALGFHAKHENLLFIDAGTFPKSKNFISNYISKINSNQVLVGGMTFLSPPPKAPFKLRWLYTKNRESKKGLHSCNFFIKKTVFINNAFDETLKGYGYEDVLFFESLKKNGYEVLAINNPVIHYADDDANTFIRKNETAIKNLIYLTETKKLPKKLIGISKYYAFLKKNKLSGPASSLFKLLKPILIKNLNSSCPSLFLYDFYRLGYYCKQKNKK